MMDKTEINLEQILKEIKEKCYIPVKGVEFGCPYCGGYAIATVGFNGNARLKCMECKVELQWE